MENYICHDCNIKMIEKETDIKTGWGKYNITISGVKGYVCPECGETIYSSEDVKMVQSLSKAYKDSEKELFLNVSETADLLRVSNQTVYNMLGRGDLKAVKVGREYRFNRKDIKGVLNPDSAKIAARNDEEEISKKDRDIIEKELEEM